MKKTEKKEKPVPKRCVCGAEAIIVKTRNGKMVSCRNPIICKANLRTTWKSHEDLAIVEWNNMITSFYSQRKGDTHEQNSL